MKLDAEALRHLSNEHFRVLTAIEMGQRNHEIVPLPLIDQIAGLRRGGTHKLLRDLGRHKLVHHDGTKYDGYRLTYQGYDFLAIKTLVRRGVLTAVGRLLGVGKESDIFEALGADGEVVVLKLHRLGRTSFRSVRKNRDYLRRGSHFSWLYLSRLAAIKEAAFMRALGDRGFPVPDAIDQNRHAVVMSHVEGYPLVQVREVRHPAQVFNELMAILCRMAAVGLVHCDYNEFNVLVSREDDAITVIDFPQMVSVTHRNAKELFDRDVECIIRFFRRKVGWDPESDPDVKVLRPDLADYAATEHSVDRELHASGFKTKHQEALEAYEWRRGSDDEGGSGDDESGDEGEGESEGEEGGGSEAGGSGVEEVQGGVERVALEEAGRESGSEAGELEAGWSSSDPEDDGVGAARGRRGGAGGAGGGAGVSERDARWKVQRQMAKAKHKAAARGAAKAARKTGKGR